MSGDLGVEQGKQEAGGPPPRVAEVVARILRLSARLVPDHLGRLVADEAVRGGFDEAVIFLADHEQRVLAPLASVATEQPPLEIDATLAGRVYQVERPFAVPAEDGGFQLWLPLIDGAERIGVLYLRSAAFTEELILQCEQLAAVVAELIVSKSQYGDALVLARRHKPMTLAAELRWATLPPLTFTGRRVAIACVLDPPYEVAGDAFDYAVNDDVLHVLIVDAMGHGLEASRMANLALAGYRHSRRRRLDLPATFRKIDAAIHSEFGWDRFVTGQMATLDTCSGTLRWLNAGHPHPLLLRQGRVASELVSEPSLPLGLQDVPLPVAEASLEPGDRLLFFTDGVVEARSATGERFGRDRLIDVTRRALADQQTLAETVRRLVRSVRAHHGGAIEDDATVLLVEWRPEQPDPV